MIIQDLELGEAQRKRIPNSRHIDHHVLLKHRLKALQAHSLPPLNLKLSHNLKALLDLILLVEI
jgi:hypothetical protein